MCCDTSAIKIGDVATAAQMVGVVVELHLLVVVVGLKVTVDGTCCCDFCHGWCTVVATEALIVHVVVIVLTIIRQVKRLVVVLDGLQLPGILVLVIDRQAVSVITCIRNAAWVCAITCEACFINSSSLR